MRTLTIRKPGADVRLGVRFFQDDSEYDAFYAPGTGADGRRRVQPIVCALHENGAARVAGLELDDMVLSINGQSGLCNTEVAAMLRELTGDISLVVRKATKTRAGASTSRAAGADAQRSSSGLITPRAVI
mmetsp:Transcript_22451/g.57721  ORF Transcript_22451/g.57721 Transcript_22451/m.57721 type:complete len:130 (+) Transcript_22451:1-390(+)